MTITRILVACGAGVTTSTLLEEKISELLDSEGYKDAYEIVCCTANEAAAKSGDFDFLVSTTGEPEGLKCPYVNGLPFLNGLSLGATEASILALMGQN